MTVNHSIIPSNYRYKKVYFDRLNNQLLDWLTYWFVDWLMVRFNIDWLINWLTNWLVDLYMTDGLIQLLTNWSTHFLTTWLTTDWLTDWLIGRLIKVINLFTDEMIYCFFNRLIESLFDRLFDLQNWLTDLLIDKWLKSWSID